MGNYTFTVQPNPTEPGVLSNFGGGAKDGNHAFLGFGSGPQTTDISASPLSSPQTISNSAVTTLTLPLNAVKVTFYGVTNTINISEADATVATKFFTLATGTLLTMDVTRCSLLYLKANTGAATLSYFFTVV